MNMRSLIPWNRDSHMPVSRSIEEASPVVALHRRMNDLFDDLWRDFEFPRSSNGWSAHWPKVELAETDKEIKLTAEVPGLAENDVDVTLHDGVLTLKGAKKIENKDSFYSEIWQGSFERSFEVGDVDPDKVHAALKNGVLTVILEKHSEAKARVKRIQINGN